jgi:16S rRNA (cytosine967-C5)-methyltransferase
MTDLREIALENIKGVLENKHDTFKSSNTEDDNAFVMMLTLTSLRKLVYIKSILKTLITKKLSKQNIIGQCALVLGTTELLYMKTPDYAVINSYVNLVKTKSDKYVAGFVNAVLRKIAK